MASSGQRPGARDLDALNAGLDGCTECSCLANGFRHVPGGGCTDRPDTMLVAINPTHRNITAHAAWDGVRFPFAGKPRLWKLLADSGWVSPELPARIAALGPTPEMVQSLVAEARRSGLYLTNAVKCVSDGAHPPSRKLLVAAWPVLESEIALVRPGRIVALGLAPFSLLTGHTVRLADELWNVRQGRYVSYLSRGIGGERYRVYPCYFPTGRGNPMAAARMLTLLRQLPAGTALQGGTDTPLDGWAAPADAGAPSTAG